MKAIILGVMFFVSTSHAGYNDEKGGPKNIHCQYSVYRALVPILHKTDINILLQHVKVENFPKETYECHKYEGKVVGCAGLNKNDKLSTYYFFNTQRGGLTIEDISTGISASGSWTQQHGITDSGYVQASLDLTTTRGGLLGDPRAFKLYGFCWASKADW